MPEQHYFLFRHCVRSTPSTVRDAPKTAAAAPSNDAMPSEAAFIASRHFPMAPDWNVPTNWCTETGLHSVQAIGAWLFSKKIHASSSNINTTTATATATATNRVIRFEILADGAAHRDIDTAYALARGLDHAAPVAATHNTAFTNLSVTGLDILRYERFLFEKEEVLLGGKQYYSDKDMLLAAQERLQVLPMPNPPPLKAWKLVQDLVGPGMLNDTTNPDFFRNRVTVVNRTAYMTGATPVLELFAQMLFYSRASNISNFVDQATTDQVYSLLQYVHWSRNICHVRNPQTACRGAVHAVALEQVLRQGSLYATSSRSRSDNQEDDETTTRATIIAAHDGDLDALATALGADWKLGPPYASTPYTPTPPASAIHIVLDESLRLSFEFLYPVYSSNVGNATEWITNTTGILEAVPLTFGSKAAPKTLDELLDHLEQERSQYPGATKCYEAAASFYRSVSEGEGSSATQVHDGDQFVLVPGKCLGLIYWLFLLMVIVYKLRRFRQRNRYAKS